MMSNDDDDDDNDNDYYLFRCHIIYAINPIKIFNRKSIFISNYIFDYVILSLFFSCFRYFSYYITHKTDHIFIFICKKKVNFINLIIILYV
jgi:hypothetical protein